MGGFEDDIRSESGFEGFLPAGCAQAPLIARFESRKSVFRARRAQVVAGLFGEFEECFGHPHADDVDAVIAGARAAATVAIPPGARVERAGLQDGSEDVAGFDGHAATIRPRNPPAK